MNFLDELSKASAVLSPVDAKKIKDRSNVDLTDQAGDELEDEAKHWNTFFQSSCTSWFEHIKEFTFSSTFCTLLPDEALVIIDHWEQLQKLRMIQSKEGASFEEITQAETNLYEHAVSQLQVLLERLEKSITAEIALSPVGKAFVKLTTRSPKDSRKALKKAEIAFQTRVARINTNLSSACIDDSMNANDRWCILSEVIAEATAVSNASDALELLLDSERVYEDLKFASRGRLKTKECTSTTSPASTNVEKTQTDTVYFDGRVDLVVRSWDPRLKPESEFRGICQDGKLTCLCQYFHPLLFPNLAEKIPEIQADILALFQEPAVRAAVLSVGNNCMIDFAWLGPGNVLIIELNPFDGVCLGIFPSSTGLFLWDNPSDRAIMSGHAPFEFRYRTEVLPKHILQAQCSKDWVNIIYPKDSTTMYKKG